MDRMKCSVQFKVCPKCRVSKPLDEFYNRRGKVGGSSYCKVCNNEAVIARTNSNKEKAVLKLGGRCSNPNCSTPGGYHRSIHGLDFHHPDGTKEHALSRIRSRSWENFWNEAKKCLLLCATCHRELHTSE